MSVVLEITINQIALAIIIDAGKLSMVIRDR